MRHENSEGRLQVSKVFLSSAYCTLIYQLVQDKRKFLSSYKFPQKTIALVPTMMIVTIAWLAATAPPHLTPITIR